MPHPRQQTARCAASRSSSTSQTASKPGLQPPDTTSFGYGALASWSSGGCASHGPRSIIRICAPLVHLRRQRVRELDVAARDRGVERAQERVRLPRPGVPERRDLREELVGRAVGRRQSLERRRLHDRQRPQLARRAAAAYNAHYGAVRVADEVIARLHPLRQPTPHAPRSRRGRRAGRAGIPVRFRITNSNPSDKRPTARPRPNQPFPTLPWTKTIRSIAAFLPQTQPWTATVCADADGRLTTTKDNGRSRRPFAASHP